MRKPKPPETPVDWLVRRRTRPSPDELALAAWQALAEAPPSDGDAPREVFTLARLQKRFGLDPQAAGVLQDGLQACPAPPSREAVRAVAAHLQDEIGQAWRQAWAEPAADEAEQRQPARFGQVLPAWPAWRAAWAPRGDTVAQAWDALRELWPAELLPSAADSHPALDSVIEHLRARMEQPAGQAPAEGQDADGAEAAERASDHLLVVCALDLAWAFDRFQPAFLAPNHPFRNEVRLQLQLLKASLQLWHCLRLRWGVVDRLAVFLGEVPLAARCVHRPVAPGVEVKPASWITLGRLDHPFHSLLRDDLQAATPDERAAARALVLRPQTPAPALPLLAHLFDDGELAAHVLDALSARGPLPHSACWLMASATDTDLQRRLAAAAEWRQLELTASPVAAHAMLRHLGEAAVPLFEQALAQGVGAEAALARLNAPEAIAALMRNADRRQAVRHQLQIALARWPLAGLVAAARLAHGGGKAATLAQGVLRQLLPELGPAAQLARPWLPPAARDLLSPMPDAGADDAPARAKEADADALRAAAPVLVDRPWLGKRKRAGAGLALPPLAVPDAVADWPEEGKQPMLAPVLRRAGLPVHRLGRGLSWNHRDDHDPVLLQWVRAIEAQDAQALIASWQGAFDAVRRRYGDFRPWLSGEAVAALPQAVGVPFWNAVAAQAEVGEPELPLARWGVAALPGTLAVAAARPGSLGELLLRLGTVAFAADAARLAFRSSQPAARSVGQQWLRAWPGHAAAGLVAPALGKPGEARDVAAEALRFLAANGHGELLRRTAALYGDEQAVRALQAVLDENPLDLFPAKFAKVMPDFWQPAAWRRPLLTDGKALGDDALTALGQMLSFARPAAPYAGLLQVRAACTPDSLAAFAWDLFGAWLAAGAPAKDNWAFLALGVFGDAACVQRLAPLMAAWPAEGASARAGLGLQVLAEIGSDAALRTVADVAARGKPKGLQARAADLLRQAAAHRGLSLEDLEDRLVPDLGLDERGQATLDYGPRRFLLALDENLKPWLRRIEDGQPGARLKGLPARNAADDPIKARAASERFKAIQAQAEHVAKVQLRRLEQAMCTGRRWSRADFEALFVRQPLMRQLATRLVWGVFAPDGGEGGALCEPLRLAADGELCTAGDEPWHGPGGAAGAALRIGLVHPLALDDAQIAAFAQLLADYVLVQPFEQLARAVSRTPPQARAAELAALQAAATACPPTRFMALKARGWRLGTGDGSLCSSATRLLPGGLDVHLAVSPGVEMAAVRSAPPQAVRELRLLGSQDWMRLDAVAYSELVRDLRQLMG
jgi:hypothetical protein